MMSTKTNQDDRVAERTEKVTFTCSPDLKSQLERWASSEGRSVSNLVERIVSQAVETKQKEQEQAEH